MSCSVTRVASSILLFTAIMLGFVPAGSSAETDARTILDGWCGFSITVGEPWQRAPLSGYGVPGAIRSAWSGPNQSSIVIFVQEPGSAISPRAMLDGSVKAEKDNLGAIASVAAVRSVAGMKAMWLVLTGKGNGGVIDGKGNVETTQHWVAVPRERDVLVVLLTCPAGDYAKLQKSFESSVGSIKVSGSQTAEQKAAK